MLKLKTGDAIHRYTNDKLLQIPEFQRLWLEGNRIDTFFNIDGRNVSLPYNPVGVSYNPSQPQGYVSEILRLCRLPVDAKYNVNFWLLLRYIIIYSTVITSSLWGSWEELV
jgi:hypothetical protein